MEKKNLLIDLSYIKTVPTGAVSVYIYAGRLIKGFEEGSVFHPIVLTAKGMEEYIDSLAGFEVEKIVISDDGKVTFSRKLDRLLGFVPFEEQLRNKQISVVLSPEFTPYSYSFPKKYKHHLVVHDLIRIHRPRGKGVFYYSLMLRWKVYRVPYLISISQSTRKLLKKWSGCNSKVIYNSIPFDFKVGEIPIAELQGKKYILDVNRFDRYKNQQALIKAFHILQDKIPHILYLKGYSCNDDINELRSLIAELGLEDRVIMDTSHRSEGELLWLYRNADLFVTPSLEEGFSYTPIEAAVLKIPVLVSDIPTLREVTQGKLELFNPHSPEELAEKMQRIISAPPSSDALEAISTFYKKEYSLETQIARLTEYLLHNMNK